MRKYYRRRYQLFSRFDDGILMDNESWFSVTPEKTAYHIAAQCYRKMGNRSDLVVLDAFCGSGGNTIQFCKFFDNVISSDIDFTKLQSAQHNCQIYGVQEKVRFVMQDFFQLHDTLKLDGQNDFKIDLIFLSPPWGGITYLNNRLVDISEFPLDGFKIFLYCLNKLKCKNIVYFLPRNSNLEQILYMAGAGGKCELEQNFLDQKLVALTAYYGDLCEEKYFVSL
jgi:trimethylguanosine synthase